MRRPQVATLVVLGLMAIALTVSIAWVSGHAGVLATVDWLSRMQENPPLWLEAPMVTQKYLAVPTLLLLSLVLVITRVSPRPRSWSRVVVVSILLALTVRYLLWRSLTTLNLDTPLNGIFSLSLFGMELLLLVSNIIMLSLFLRARDRRPEAERLSQRVLSGAYTPTVDVLIPTYNEPEFIVRRTVIGCQALNYPTKQVYVLDDTQRPEIEAMARQLGCHYLTRPDNRHAKAGNLNHALEQVSGELVVVFDADFVPTQNFLTRTVGFFSDPQVALVQTPQTFYNADPVARNLGLEHVLTPEEEVFYRQIQPIRDGAGSVICAGTSFVVRRSALEEAGGFVTDSLSEDYFTGIRISARGYRLVYLDEKLSAGLAAENIAAHAMQRLRWARGTLQAFFIQSNPLTIPGLKPIQRLAHLEGLLHWFTSISRVGFLLMPLAYSFLGVIPLRATAQDLLFFFVPYYVVSLTVFSWLNERSRSAILSDIYSFALCFPLAITVIQTMLNPFTRGFKVTPKGLSSDRFHFNWKLGMPLLILFFLTAMSLIINLKMAGHMGTLAPEAHQMVNSKGLGIGWLWSIYNLVMLGIGLLILLDVPRPSLYDWFEIQRTVRLRVNGQDYWGHTTLLSEIGAEVMLTQALRSHPMGDHPTVQLTFMEANITVTGHITRHAMGNGLPTLRILFNPMGVQDHRQLVEMLFCRPGQWQSRRTPGELASLLLLVRALITPRILFDRHQDGRAIALSKG
ncbi:glycosyltransferase [Leptolyngbya sp. AN02str]|uniref:glycosyltransferase family 2 protein n=1 Tax=Leptolyngbya sp. AN02str TaxID=3423363 RepID=UPI003D32219E